jgi:hypothetical protein
MRGALWKRKEGTSTQSTIDGLQGDPKPRHRPKGTYQQTSKQTGGTRAQNDSHHAAVESTVSTFRPCGCSEKLQRMRGIRLDACTPISEIAKNDESLGAALASREPQRGNGEVCATELLLERTILRFMKNGASSSIGAGTLYIYARLSCATS